jgi:CheY-like chemotaxis protein
VSVASPVNRADLMGTGPSSPSILVVEDNADSRDALKALLEAYGFTVIEAQNGQEAITKALSSKPDLVLMDIMMPVMDGLQATRNLRSHPEFAHIPILALSAMVGARDLAIKAGCDDHLTKPMEMGQFVRTIRNWLDRRRNSSG